MKQAAERLKQAVSAGVFLTDEPMSRHTTFRTGGPADIYIEPSCAEELKQVLDICREENLAYTIIGNGSNLLVGDKGYRGVLISFGKPFGQVTVEGTQVRAGAGALLSVVAKQALNASLTGFEFAAGHSGHHRRCRGHECRGIRWRAVPGLKRGNGPHTGERGQNPSGCGTGAWLPHQLCSEKRLYGTGGSAGITAGKRRKNPCGYG